MKKSKRRELVSRHLDIFFPNPKIPLVYDSPYTLLIATLLSAQCTDKRVNLVTPTLFSRANDPQEMGKMSREEIQEIIRPCGLSGRKSQAIKELSEILIGRYGGEVPKTLEELESLPGVGHKTASVVLVQAFGQAAFPVDTHIHRCAKRWQLTNGKDVRETERDLKKLFAKREWGLRHLQIIYYARSYCPARAHDLEKCCICKELGTLSRSGSRLQNHRE